jgi:hypothetical protein
MKLPPGKNKIGLMWVFKAKGDKDGAFTKVKGRLTLMGNQERNVLSKAAAYAPVTHPATLRLMIAMYMGDPDVHFWQLDVAQAYLSSLMKREVYTAHPPGFKFHANKQGKLCFTRLRPGEQAPNTVMRLLRALYGGMECGRLFWEKFTYWHLAYGFEPIHHDKCYLMLKREDGFVRICYHVDDGAIAQKGSTLFKQYKDDLGKAFTYTLGSLEKYVGIRIRIDRKMSIVTFDQAEQIDKMLKDMDWDGKRISAGFHCSPVPDSGRMPTMADVPTDPGELARCKAKFDMQKFVGHCQWLQGGTRVDISWGLKILSRYTVNYGMRHIQWAKHMMKYLASTKQLTLTFRAGLPKRMQIFTDASHAGCVDTRRSITGVVIKFAGNTVLWKSMYQSIVSHSSCESELMALDKGATLGQYIRWLSIAIGAPKLTPIAIYVDNKSTVDLSNNPVHHGRNLHVHARFFYVRDLVLNKEYTVDHIASADQISDVLCSYKGKPNFHALIHRVMGCAHVVLDREGKFVWDDSLIVPPIV